jgi:hypothetical protein
MMGVCVEAVMKFAILILVSLPPLLLLMAWISMQLKLIPVRREATEEEKRKLAQTLQALVNLMRLRLLEIQKQNDAKGK